MTSSRLRYCARRVRSSSSRLSSVSSSPAYTGVVIPWNSSTSASQAFAICTALSTAGSERAETSLTATRMRRMVFMVVTSGGLAGRGVFVMLHVSAPLALVFLQAAACRVEGVAQRHVCVRMFRVFGVGAMDRDDTAGQRERDVHIEQRAMRGARMRLLDHDVTMGDLAA